MAVIEVNHRVLRTFAQQIEDHCDLQNREIRQADISVKNNLGVEWYGDDAVAFGSSWDGVDSKDSVAIKLRDSMNNYAKALKACAQEYQKAQEDIYNLASMLPRW